MYNSVIYVYVQVCDICIYIYMYCRCFLLYIELYQVISYIYVYIYLHMHNYIRIPYHCSETMVFQKGRTILGKGSFAQVYSLGVRVD